MTFAPRAFVTECADRIGNNKARMVSGSVSPAVASEQKLSSRSVAERMRRRL